MRVIFSTILLLAIVPSMRAETVDELIKSAGAEIKDGKYVKALALLDKAIALDIDDVRPLLMRASVYGTLDRHRNALTDLNSAAKKSPDSAAIYQQRGITQFKLGNSAASIADFDKAIELDPKLKAGHWQRGISYYYAGQFDEGARQFEGYQEVDNNDVENAVWRYLCMARKDGVAKARKAMLKIGQDTRVPMKQIYELFRGRAKPADVLEAARAGKPPEAQLNARLFYAHLYLGLYYETEGDKKKALEHLTSAAEKHRIGHYMWDVARVHRDLLRKELK